MFGLLGGNSSVFAGRRDPTHEKTAPPYPTPICFPSLKEGKHTNGGHEHSPDFSGISCRVARIRKPPDLNLGLLDAINLGTASEIDINHIVPKHVTSTNLTLHNGRPVPTRDDFLLRSKELAVENEDGYNLLAGKARANSELPRLGHFRRFWEGLDSMANYWDTSMDEYIPPKYDGDESKADNPASPPELAKRTKTELCPGAASSPSTRSKPRRQGKVPGTYRGYRMANGTGMPDVHRLDTVRSFLETITWPFGLTVQPPRRPSLLALGNLRVPVRLTYSVWRVPKERERAQGRWVEGPIIGVSCRHETGFRPGGVESIVDVLQETTALLLIAQERAREGSTERKPGEGKWWATVPRWGGGPGGEIGEGRGNEDEKPVPNGHGRKVSEPEVREKMKERRREYSKKPSALEAWKTIKPGVGYWDPKADFQRIGRDPASPNDQVFLVSSLNHHISLLKMEVHPKYIQHLASGAPLRETSPDSSWQRPAIVRSRWYDLFSPEDRLEAMEALWQLTAYLSRVESEDVDMAEEPNGMN